MQHHELKKYLEFTINKKPVKWKTIKNFAHEPTGIFKKILLLKKDAKLVINGKTRTMFTFLELFMKTLLPESLTEWSELF